MLQVTDPTSGLALARLQSRVKSYELLLDRMGAARLSLDVAKTAFAQRYAVFSPAEMPESPRRGGPWLFWIGGLLLCPLFACGMAALTEALRGRFVASGQVAWRLGLPVLGEVDPPEKGESPYANTP